MNYNDKPGTPEELVHFGVKGMRWGTRKPKTSSTKKPDRKEVVKSKAKKKVVRSVLKNADKIYNSPFSIPFSLGSIGLIGKLSLGQLDLSALSLGDNYVKEVLDIIGLRKMSPEENFQNQLDYAKEKGVI